MKKSIYYLLFAILAMACSKENISNSYVKERTFTASVEQYEDELKTALVDGIYVEWRTGDRIKVFDSNAVISGYQATTNGKSTSFSLFTTDEASGEYFYAAYPYEKCIAIENGAMQIEYNSTQNYSNGSFASGSFPMVAYTEGSTFEFKNIGGILLLNLKTSNIAIRVSQIEISADQDLYGKVNVSYNGTGNPSVTSIQDGGKTLVVSFDEPLCISSTATPIYVAVPGNDYTNVNVKVMTDAGVEQSLYAAAVGVIRSKKTTLNASANRLYMDVAMLNSTQVGYSERKNGNCYVINEAGSYKLPLLEGIKTTELDADGVSIIWQQNEIIGDVSLSSDGKYLQFNTVPALPQGNALVAASKDDEIIWSWHIWSTNFRLGVDDKSYVGHKWMDRFLGGYIPKTVTIDGEQSTYYVTSLYYGFMRKDPIQLQAPTSEQPDYITATRNPKRLYARKANENWSAEMGKYNWNDQNPCPVGYTFPGDMYFPTTLEGKDYIAGGMSWYISGSYLDGYNGWGYNYDGRPTYWCGNSSWYVNGTKKEVSARNAYRPVRCVRK